MSEQVTPHVQRIVSRWDSNKVLFECELPDGLDSGMAVRHALEKATASGAYLRGADLRDADLSGAYLRGAYLRGAGRATDEQAIANLDKVREIILDDAKRLAMGHWHADKSEWREHTCAEEMLCGTTHCLAGWLQVCSTDEKVRTMDPEIAGIIQAPIAAKMFFRDETDVINWLRDRKYVIETEYANKLAAELKAMNDRPRVSPSTHFSPDAENTSMP